MVVSFSNLSEAFHNVPDHLLVNMTSILEKAKALSIIEMY